MQRTPPAAILLIHGAGSGPWVFSGWREAFPGVTVEAVDLHEGLDVAHASHADFLARVVQAAASLPRPLCVCGWSMGGLVALQAADRMELHSVILLEPSAPLEVQGAHPEVELLPGTFEPTRVYGAFPTGVRSRPESSLARAERKHGVPVPSISCPALVLYGDEFRDERGPPIAQRYGAEARDFPGLDHWGLVQNGRVREAIAAYLGLI